MTLFGDWLERTRELQIRYYGNDPMALEGDAKIDYIKWNYIAAVKELGEMLDEIGWKPWATSRHVYDNAAAGEIVDVMHFLANMLLAFGWTDEDLGYYYAKKMQKNRERMATGLYDGVTGKCPVCHRALDDEYVLCTLERCVND